MVRFAFAFSMLALMACGAPERGDDSDGDTGDSAMDDGADGNDDGDDGMVMAKKCNKMDLMFVVDDSASMDLEQSNLASNFPSFANVLSTFTTADGDPIDYRIAVTTTGKDFKVSVSGLGVIEDGHGPDGGFMNNCGLTKRWLEPSDANMQSTLACRANVGTGGSSYEMPLLMTKDALSARMSDGTNTGFLRDDALLAVVYLTDEDDGSLTQNSVTVSTSSPEPTPNFQPQELVDFLDTTKGGRTHWAAGVIAGESECSSSFGDAKEAKRLKQFVMLANNGGTTQAVFSSICAGDLTAGLTSALATFQNACNSIVGKQ